MKQKLIDQVLDQILQDVAMGDLTAIEELIKNLPNKTLQGFLPELEATP
jgi:hypothetical protein